ncbi:hypothetical protein ASswx1_379 [Aeromonas phage Asswx_1]|uniref:Uncharacterized protein n=1 Tax=Aeromonas phage Asswx_1 TaxID=2419739 RepID=A0A411B8S4_9CAUD|nr:hypothetical protein ASswx1_379 [Aeromonas phage Asswx_1]
MYTQIHKDTADYFGYPICLSLAMTGIKSMINHESSYVQEIESKLKSVNRAPVFSLWDYDFIITQTHSGKRILNILNKNITPAYIGVIDLGNCWKVNLRELIEVASDLYKTLVDEGFDHKKYFIKSFVPDAQFEMTEFFLSTKVWSLKLGSESTFYATFYFCHKIRMSISTGFYNPPLITDWFTGTVGSKEMTRWTDWYKFESLETKLKRHSAILAAQVLV